MISVLALLACRGGEQPVSGDPVLPATPRPVLERPFKVEFSHLEITDAVRQAREPVATSWVVVDRKRIDLAFRPFAREGVDGFGQLRRADGSALDDTCGPDATGLLPADGKLWWVTHQECTPGAITVTEVRTDDGGLFSAGASTPAEFSAVGGVWSPCAGQISPWGTYVGSEEFEPDAAGAPTPGSAAHRRWVGMQRYFADGAMPSAYTWGWTPELRVGADGASTVVKHKAPGRFSHEKAQILPDERTVYLSDDTTGGGWFLFVADRPRDLSSGWLYAARLEQTSAAPFAAKVAWVSLGHADNAAIDAAIDAGVSFDDLFERASPREAACDEGFARVRANGADECLKLRPPSPRAPDPAKLASRLETRRYAGLIGATTELEKAEGQSFDPTTGAVYLALSSIGGRMLDEGGAPDDRVRMAENPCGAVVFGVTESGVTDASKTLIGSKHVVTSLQLLVAGTPVEPDADGNTCLRDGIANPDNLAVLPGYDVLMIAEDTSRHTNASLWALEMRAGLLKRVLAAPQGGEITGIQWAPNVGGRGYLTLGIQHPWSGRELPEGATDADRRGFIGYLGPLPPLD